MTADICTISPRNQTHKFKVFCYTILSKRESMASKAKIKTKTFKVTVEISLLIKTVTTLFGFLDGLKTIPDSEGDLKKEIYAIESLLKPMIKSGFTYPEKLWLAVNYPNHAEFIRKTLGRKLSHDFPYGLRRMKDFCEREAAKESNS